MTTFTGTSGNDTINASTGTISTGVTGGTVGQLQDSNNDTIDGGGGNDTIVAGSGNDTITGGDGTDAINGGNGNDTFNIAIGDFDDGELIDGSAGNDTIALTTPGDGVHIDFSVGTIANVENLTTPNASGSNDYDQTITLSATQWAGLSSIDMNDGTDVLNVVASGDISADTTNPTLEEVETSNP